MDYWFLCQMDIHHHEHDKSISHNATQLADKVIINSYTIGPDKDGLHRSR